MPLRLMIGFIPENSFEMNVKQGELNAYRRGVILQTAYSLDKATGNVDASPLSSAMFEWSKNKALEAQKENDKVADYIRRRCGSTIGMRAGVVSAVIRNLKKWDRLPVKVLNEQKGLEEASKEYARCIEVCEDDLNLARFVADYCFEQQYKLFKRPILKAMSENIIPSPGIVFPTSMQKTIEQFDRLSPSFTAKDVSDIFEVTPSTAAGYCSRWKAQGIVKYDRNTKKYVKNGNNLQS